MPFVAGSPHTAADILVAVGELRRRHTCSLELAEEIMFLMNAVLPSGNTCPPTFAVNLLALQAGELDIRREHCCPCDHFIYQDKAVVRCPVCDESRYVEVTSSHGNTKRPRKVTVTIML